MTEQEFFRALRRTRGEWKLLAEGGWLRIRTKKPPRACPITRLDPLGQKPAAQFDASANRLKLRYDSATRIARAADDEGFSYERLRRKLLDATGLVAAERRLRAKLRREKTARR